MYIYVAGNVDDAGNVDVDVPALLEDSTGPFWVHKNRENKDKQQKQNGVPGLVLLAVNLSTIILENYRSQQESVELLI
jgi:hypothetical protein